MTLGDAVVAAGESEGDIKKNGSPPSRLQMHAEGGLGSKAAPSLPLWLPPFGIPLWVGVRKEGVQRGETLGGGGGSPAAIPFNETSKLI